MLKHLLTLIAIACSSLLAASTVAGSQSPAGASQEQDLLDLNSGAMVLSWSSQYDEEWAALLLVDDTTERGWSAGEGAEFPHQFLIEMAQPTRLTSIAIDNSGTLEGDYPGISAREIEVWVSNDGPDEEFDKVMTVEAQQGERSAFTLPQSTPARWIKLKVLSNWGHDRYTELREVEGYGEPLDNDTPQPDLAGVYDTNWELMRFEQAGNQVRGCYDFDGGTLTGSTDGRVVQFEWRENGGDEVGTALMVLSSTGEQLSGLWNYEGEYKGLWIGSPAGPGEQPDCTIPTSNNLSQSLANSGSAIVYGIRFDLGESQLRAESQATLQEAHAALEAQPELNLIIEGHTDATGSAAANRELSERRAQAVKTWLVDHGIGPERLQARGHGDNDPVASNDTAQGRALNRRVELERMQR